MASPQSVNQIETLVFNISKTSKRQVRFAPILFFSVSFFQFFWIWRVYQRTGFTLKVGISLFLCVLLFAFFVYSIYHAVKIRQVRFETDSKGISRMEGNGKTQRALWGEVGMILETSKGGSITLYDKAGVRIFVVPVVLDGFDRLKKLIYARADLRKEQSKPRAEMPSMSSKP